jgi:phosphoribosyl-AMP cyclohydrolase
MKSVLDEIEDFRPQFDEKGLIPVITQDARDHQVKMMAWMNAEALRLTLESGYVHYWARSRQTIWRKGEESGHHQKVVDIRIDCDQDCLLILIEQEGAACHTKRPSCFYRSVTKEQSLIFLN